MSAENRGDAAFEALVEQMAAEVDVRRHVKRRLDLLIWIAVAMLTLAAVSVVVRMINYYGLRQEVSIRAEVVRSLTATTSELTRRNNKLRAEVAIRDARFQASKGIVGGGEVLRQLLAVQEIVDRYALEHMRNGINDKTADDVRREVCDELAAAGFKCVP